MKSGAVQKYPTMSLDEIAELPIKSMAAKDSCIFMWITTPLKYEIIQYDLFKRWGFKYKTTIFWRKTARLGLGYYWRGAVEECLFGVRGKIAPFRNTEENVIDGVLDTIPESFEAPVREHSQKPEEFFDIIEPSLEKWDLNPKIELFCRGRPRKGWDGWGNQTIHDGD